MIKEYENIKPQIHAENFIAENASIIGRVETDENVNIWFGVVVRGDVNYIKIGKNTNIQDNAVVHVSDLYPCIIGQDVTVGHSAIVHGCTIKDNVLIGMGAIILDGAVVEENVIIGAGALIPPGKIIPKNSLVVGSPGKVVRELNNNEVESLKESSRKYVTLSKKYK